MLESPGILPFESCDGFVFVISSAGGNEMDSLRIDISMRAVIQSVYMVSLSAQKKYTMSPSVFVSLNE